MMRPATMSLLLLSACTAQLESPTPATSPTLEEIATGKRTLVDLSHALNESNPHWPGEGYEPFRFQTIATFEEDGVFSGAFSTPEHLGTHLDAPNHFESDQPSVDEIPLTRLLAPLAVLDVRQQSTADPDYQVREEDIRRWENDHGPLPEGAVLAALTGWSDRWDDYDAYKNADDDGGLHFPGFSAAAARAAIERAAAGLMIDTLSVDYGPSADFEVHHITNSAGLYHIENAARLEEVPASGAWVLIAPIKIEGGSGGPARVWAIF